MEELNWKHGFTQRTEMDTDTERVRQIMNEGKVITKSVIEQAISLENRIKPSDPLKTYKVAIINAVLITVTTAEEHKETEAEQTIKTMLSREPKLSSFVSHIRQTLK